MDKVFGGWALSGMITKSSGLRVYVIRGWVFSLRGGGFDRPDLVGNPIRSFSSRGDMVAKYFNTTAFVANQPGHYGSPARNLFTAPGSANTDVSLLKSFPLGERMGKLQFRAELFNTLNQVRFWGPVSSLSTTTFGPIHPHAPPRVIHP